MMLLDITWNVDPTIFKIGPLEIRWYGLLFASGFLVGYQIMAKIFKIENKPEKDLDALLMTMILSTVLGARIGHYVFYEGSHFMEDPIKFMGEMLIPPYSGLASHGAAFGILLGLFIFVSRHKEYSYLWVTDRMVIISALAGCFIRFGNLMNSEIVGKPTDVPWAFTFLQKYSDLPEVPRHPSQLYESISCFILFVILYGIYNKMKENTPRGLLTGIFFVWVFTLRFFYEYLKENQKSFEDSMSLNMGQILSIPIVIFGAIILFYSFKNKQTV